MEVEVVSPTNLNHTTPGLLSSQPSSFNGHSVSHITETEPKVALSCLEKTVKCVIKSLFDFIITVFNITFTILISAPLIVAGGIYGLRLVAEFAYNRYLHYEKHHVGELAIQRKNLHKKQKENAESIKNALQTHLEKLQALNVPESSTAQVSELLLSAENDPIWIAINRAYNQHDLQFNEAKDLRDNVKHAKMKLDELKIKAEDYFKESDQAVKDINTALDNSCQSLEQAMPSCDKVKQYIHYTQEKLALIDEELQELNSMVEGRVCQACCPTCNSCIAESLPSSLRAVLITLVSLPYLIPCGVIMGAVNTVRLVAEVTWITCPSKVRENQKSETDQEQEERNKFPWQSPFPFGDGKNIGQCCPV